MRAGLFFEALERLLEKTIEFETKAGVFRRGKITGFTHGEIMFGKSKVNLINSIELNGDPSDRVPISEIVRLEKV